MTDDSLYQAPSSDLTAEQSDEQYQPQVFAMRGRIGRLRYIAYYMAYVGLVYAALLIAMLIGFVAGDPGVVAVASSLSLGIAALAGLFGAFVLMRRRLHDLDQSGWWSLLCLVPLLNIALALYLLFAPGGKLANQYGPAPCANPKGVYVAAFVPLAFVLVSVIVAALSIPAYDSYLQRAQQAQSDYLTE